MDILILGVAQGWILAAGEGLFERSYAASAESLLLSAEVYWSIDRDEWLPDIRQGSVLGSHAEATNYFTGHLEQLKAALSK